MKDEQIKQVKEKQGTEILHIPTVMGAVVVTYNIKGVGKGLKLTPDVLADIFLGKITKWKWSDKSRFFNGLNFYYQQIFLQGI